jgi:hypothetical protein
VPSQDRGLLARLDALVALVVDRHGLALLPDGRLAAAKERAAAHAAGLRPSADDDLGALGLLRALGEAVGLLRTRAAGWRPPRCATPGARSTRACGQDLRSLLGASK